MARPTTERTRTIRVYASDAYALGDKPAEALRALLATKSTVHAVAKEQIRPAPKSPPVIVAKSRLASLASVLSSLPTSRLVDLSKPQA
jgi:hypothetical protein